MKINTAKLIHERKKRGWTLTEMGYRCGCSASMISMIEQGDRFGYKTVVKMAKALKLPVDTVMPEEKTA